jgi:hypothetical protein
MLRAFGEWLTKLLLRSSFADMQNGETIYHGMSPAECLASGVAKERRRVGWQVVVYKSGVVKATA